MERCGEIDLVCVLFALLFPSLRRHNGFRKLKYTVGLLHFHGKKTDFVMQELYARLTMYIYAEAIVSAEAREKQSKQHAYQINFTTAF